MTTHVFLSPGMFGFDTLGSFEYFCHIKAGLRRRFRADDRPVEIHVVDVHPTASIRRRGARLHDAIVTLASGAGDIHLVGHSTGGLDARLVTSPSIHLPELSSPRDVFCRVKTVTTMNTPHYGTPLASFFATVSGQRLLYAVSALTVSALKLGAPPLALASTLVASFGRIDRAFGLEISLLERLTEGAVKTLDDASGREVRAYLKLLRGDQGAIVQLTPESMDLFEAGIEDAPSVRYRSVATYAPAPGAVHWAKTILSPWDNMTFPIFAALSRLADLESETYPCRSSSPDVDVRLTEALARGGDHDPPPFPASDGVVPLRSQVWGEIAWAGKADHLDVVGHFGGGGAHVDWLSSRAHFTREKFDAMLDAVYAGMRPA